MVSLPLRTPPKSTDAQHRPLFLLRHKVYDMRGSQKAIANPPTKLTSILRTSHSAYNLAATSLYVLSHVRIDFTIDDQKPEPPERGIPVGSVSQLKFWPYLRSVQLDITLRTDGDETLVLERIRQVIEALERGKHLRRLWIDLDWEDGKPIPGSFDAVVEALGALEMSHARGGVSITVKGDMEDEEKERIEERVTAKLEDRPEERLERRERDWQGLEKA